MGHRLSNRTQHHLELHRSEINLQVDQCYRTISMTQFWIHLWATFSLFKKKANKAEMKDKTMSNLINFFREFYRLEPRIIIHRHRNL